MSYRSTPDNHYTAEMERRANDVNSPDKIAVRRATNKSAVEQLKPLLRKGDRIRAIRGECGCSAQTYTFEGWDGQWIISKSGINTIIPASVDQINGVKIERPERKKA